MRQDEMHEQLLRLNRTELIQIAREAGLGDLTRACDVEDLADLLVGGPDACVEADNLGPWRRAIEAHIKVNFSRLRSQLPNCTGNCTSFGCPVLTVTRCWEGFSRDMV